MVAFEPNASDRDWTSRETTRDRGVWGWGVPGSAALDMPAIVRKMARKFRAAADVMRAFGESVANLPPIEDDETTS